MVQSTSNGQAVAKLGFADGQIVLELGYDTDTDDDLRVQIEERVDTLEDEDYDGVVDAVLLWWRDDDGDLADALVDALTPLESHGFIVLLTPKVGTAGEVDPSDISEAADLAGLHAGSSVNLTPDWSATRLVSPTSAARR